MSEQRQNPLQVGGSVGSSSMTEREQYDRLLELEGGCVHDWGDFSDNGSPRYFCKRQGCGAAHYKLNPPAVGDGHQMTLGEMARLWAKLNRADGHPMVSGVLLVCDHGTPDEPCGEWAANVRGSSAKGRQRYNTPEAALAAALLAAVDGERA